MSNLPIGWKEVTLSEVCTKIQDGNYGTFYPKSHEFLESGIPFLTSKAIGSNGILIPSKIDYISPEKHAELKKAHLKLNDILFTNRGANVGAIGIVGENISHGNIGPQLTLLRANEKITPNFLLYSMRSSLVKKQIESNDSGSAMNFFGIKETSKFKLYLPPLEEQKKIADILSTVDKKIAFVEENINATEELKKGLMQKLLTEGIGHTEFKDSELGRIPESWEIYPLKKGVISFIVPMRDKPKIFNGNIPWCRIEDFNGKYLEDSKSNQYVSEETISSMNLKVYPVGTVLCSCSARLGVCSITTQKLITNQTFIGLVVNSEYLFNEYLYYVMISYANKLQSLSTGTTISYLPREKFEKFTIQFPPLKEQKQIAEILSTVDNKLENLKEKKQSFEELKKGLMQKLLTGEVRV